MIYPTQILRPSQPVAYTFWSPFPRVRFKTVFLNRRTAARYRNLASIIPGREGFSWVCHFSFLGIFHE